MKRIEPLQALNRAIAATGWMLVVVLLAASVIFIVGMAAMVLR